MHDNMNSPPLMRSKSIDNEQCEQWEAESHGALPFSKAPKSGRKATAEDCVSTNVTEMLAASLMALCDSKKGWSYNSSSYNCISFKYILGSVRLSAGCTKKRPWPNLEIRGLYISCW